MFLPFAHYKVKQHVIQVFFTFSSLQSKTACNTGMFFHLAHYKVKQHVLQVCFTFSSLQSKTACDTCMFLHLAHLLIKYKMKKAHTFGTVPKSNIKL